LVESVHSGLLSAAAPAGTASMVAVLQAAARLVKYVSAMVAVLQAAARLIFP
jgi:hypothetical protein